MSDASSRRLLILVLPDLGGIGKSTLSEQLVAMLEVAGRPVVAIDGDPTSRGLMARRNGRRTIPVLWPDEYESRARAIRGAVKEGHVGVLDFGGGSTLTLSVDPTIAELCDGSTSHGVETVVMVIGEASKPGLATAIARLRTAYPHVRFMFCRNAKSGSDWSSFTGCAAGLPTFDLPAMPPAITEWLSNHRVVHGPKGEVSRPALADLVMDPQPGYKMIGYVIGGYLNDVSQQPVIQALLQVPSIEYTFKIRPSLVLGRGPMNDAYLTAHMTAAVAMSHIVAATPPPAGQEAAWCEDMGRHVLKYAQSMQAVRAVRAARPG